MERKRSEAAIAAANAWANKNKRVKQQQEAELLDTDCSDSEVEIIEEKSVEPVTSPIQLIHSVSYGNTTANKDTVKLSDLVSLDGLVKTFQFSFAIDCEYLIPHIKSKTTEIVLVCSQENANVPADYKRAFNIKQLDVKVPKFGSHHTKMMVNLFADNHAEIVILTANMTLMDFDANTQMVWRSPKLHMRSGNSQPAFKGDFLAYLKEYDFDDLSTLAAKLEKYDFSQVKADFVSSVPGKYRLDNDKVYGYGKLYDLMKKHTLFADRSKTTKIVAQMSSIASSLQPWKAANVFTHLLAPLASGGSFPLSNGEKSVRDSMAAHSFEPIIIYPTVEEVRASHFKTLGGNSIFFNDSKKHEEAHVALVRRFLYKWGAGARDSGRAKLVPHCKTYTATSDNFKSLDWFLMTSGNLSKQAWGAPSKGSPNEYEIKSYEAGVLIHPALWVERPSLVPSLKSDTLSTCQRNCIPVRIPYSIPLEKYSLQEEPWNIAKHGINEEDVFLLLDQKRR